MMWSTTIGKQEEIFTLRIVEINTEFAFDRQRKVVFPRLFRLVTARTIAGCWTLNIREHERYKDLASSGSICSHMEWFWGHARSLLLWSLFHGLRAMTVLFSSISVRFMVQTSYSYTRSVHWTLDSKSSIFRRISGALTSKIHRSVSWSAMDLFTVWDAIDTDLRGLTSQNRKQQVVSPLVELYLVEDEAKI